MKTILLHNQSLIDISIQTTGIAENALFIAKENGYKLTDEVKAGTTLVIPLGLKIDKDMVNYYTVNSIKPACGLTGSDKQILEQLEGISIWTIGVDFIIGG